MRQLVPFLIPLLLVTSVCEAEVTCTQLAPVPYTHRNANRRAIIWGLIGTGVGIALGTLNAPKGSSTGVKVLRSTVHGSSGAVIGTIAGKLSGEAQNESAEKAKLKLIQERKELVAGRNEEFNRKVQAVRFIPPLEIGRILTDADSRREQCPDNVWPSDESLVNFVIERAKAKVTEEPPQAPEVSTLIEEPLRNEVKRINFQKAIIEAVSDRTVSGRAF